MNLPVTFNNYLRRRQTIYGFSFFERQAMLDTVGLRRPVLLSFAKGALLRINVLILTSALMMTASMQAMEKETPTTNNDQLQQGDQFIKSLGIDTKKIFEKSLTDMTGAATHLPESAEKSWLLTFLATEQSKFAVQQQNKK